MNKTIIKTEPTEEEDEENGRTTPVRKSVLEYELTMNTTRSSVLDTNVIVKQESQEVGIPTDENVGRENALSATIEQNATISNNTENNSNVAPQTMHNNANELNANAKGQTSLEELHNRRETSQASTSKVLVKDESQDLADLETTIARLDGEANNGMDNIASPELPSSTIHPLPYSNTDAVTSTPENSSCEGINTAQTALERVSPKTEGVVKKGLGSIADFWKNDVDASKTDDAPPPPPPKISTVPIVRLTVKSEFSVPPSDPEPITESLPNDFFEDILTESINARPIVEIQPKDEPIPDNFFDDLLVDKIQERIEEAETQDLEVKYVDRLKQLKELEELEQAKEREKRKHKKSKKKSRKRTPSPSPQKRRRLSSSRSPTPEGVRHKLMRWPDKSDRSDWLELPSTTNSIRSRRVDDEYEVDFRSKLEYIRRNANKHSPMEVDENPLPKRLTSVNEIEILDEPVKDGVQPHLPEIREDFTMKQKKDRILLRAKTLISYLNTAETKKDKPLSTFLYTSIVRKLPASHSYRNQHVYENRSPLHTVNNVSYKFNSHARRFNLEEWGLDSLPPVAANIAKLVGYDAQTIHNKLKVIKIPAKLRKIKKESGCDNEDEEEDESLRARSSLFCTVSTQTDETVDVLKRKPRGYDIGVQAVQPAFEIGCQTLETESPSIQQFDNNDDLPIMGIMRELNENQLMALHDFAELLKEPASNAMDMYRLRQRMLDIYKCSQLPSAMSLPVPVASVNSYSSNEERQPLRIQSAAGADGSCFSVSDPHMNFNDRRNRDKDNNEVIRNANSYDSRNSQSSRHPNTSRGWYNEPMQHRRQSQKHPEHTRPQSTGTKFYGRGAMRR